MIESDSIPLQVTESDLIELAEIVMVSNTPYFLFDRMRKSEALLRINRNHSVSQLREALLEFLKLKPIPEEAAVAAYACMIALSNRGEPEAASVLGSIDTGRLRWGMELSEFALKAHRPTYSFRQSVEEPTVSECPTRISTYSA